MHPMKRPRFHCLTDKHLYGYKINLILHTCCDHAARSMKIHTMDLIHTSNIANLAYIAIVKFYVQVAIAIKLMQARLVIQCGMELNGVRNQKK